MMARREKRKRDHIPLTEKLASALADKLPQAERDALRAARVPAQRIISMFTPDHVVLHALGGSDEWHNLTMARRGPALKAKDGRDTSAVAKSDRVSAAHREHLAAMARKLVGPSPFAEVQPAHRGDAYWKKKRELQSRWPKGRKLQSRSSFEGRR